MKKWTNRKNLFIGLGAIALSLSLIVWANWSQKCDQKIMPLHQEFILKIENNHLSNLENSFSPSGNIQKFIKMLSKNKRFLNKNLILTGNSLTEETVQYALCKGFSVTWLKTDSLSEKKLSENKKSLEKQSAKASHEANLSEEDWQKKALKDKSLLVIDCDGLDLCTSPELEKKVEQAIQKTCMLLVDSNIKTNEQKNWSNFFHFLVQKMPSKSFVWVKLVFEIDSYTEDQKNSFFEKEWKKEIMSLKDFQILQWSHAQNSSYQFLKTDQEKEVLKNSKQFQILMQKK